MTAVRYVSLADLFPNVSRATRYRWRKAGKLGKPDLVVNNREYYREDRQFASPADADHHTAKPGSAGAK